MTLSLLVLKILKPMKFEKMWKLKSCLCLTIKRKDYEKTWEEKDILKHVHSFVLMVWKTHIAVNVKVLESSSPESESNSVVHYIKSSINPQ